MHRVLPLGVIVLIFIASQFFWFRHIGRWGRGLIPKSNLRKGLAAICLALYFGLFAYNLPWIARGPTPVHLTLGAALLEAPFRWWVVSSILGFIIVLALWLLYRAFRAALWTTRKVKLPSRTELSSPARRHFLEKTAVAVGAIPFAACAYGLLYGRLNLEITRKRIKLRRLPKAFDSFRIAQLSDIHIGPFMPAEEIRKYVALANRLKPDLVVLTGDFVTWDASTQGAVVQALADLKAPFGVFGCLGNHEMWTETEDSITRLFAQKEIRILRQERAAIESGGETLNLIGVDFQTRRRLGRHGDGFVPTYLAGVETLVVPETANLLLSHNPNSFDRAAQLGIDLTLAGHTHGGQVTLEFVHRNLSPSNLITKYVEGWFEKNGAQLYVNRGIGTIAVPIRLNATPEITIFELVREV